MGLLAAGVGALSGVLADQWREFFYCDALPANVLAVKGQKRISAQSTNVHGTENVISNGSVISVADGQCMIIVESGEVVEVSAVPGQFVYDTSVEPSIFSGNLGESIMGSFKEMAKRFTFGADVAKDQRIYYFNTKEVPGNKYGTANPVPFRVVDQNIGLDIDISVRCNGEYSYRLSDPLLFYKNVCGNVEEAYTRDMIDSQLKSELLTALQPAFARISAMGIRYSAVPGHTAELAELLNDELSEDWRELRGIEIASFGVNSIAASPEDEKMIKELQKTAVMRDPTMAAASIASAQSDAMRAAATNEGGAMMGFMGMGMANAIGGMNAQDLFQVGQQQSQAQGQVGQQSSNTPQAAAVVQGQLSDWMCSCGTQNTGKFCQECGGKKPEPVNWICGCGASNTGKFCQECGNQRP